MGLAGQTCDNPPARCTLPGEMLPLGPRRELRGERGGCELSAGACCWWGAARAPCLRTPCRGRGHPAKPEIVQGRAAAPPCPQHSPGSGSGSNGISVPAAPVPPALAQQPSCLGWGRVQPLCLASAAAEPGEWQSSGSGGGTGMHPQLCHVPGSAAALPEPPGYPVLAKAPMNMPLCPWGCTVAHWAPGHEVGLRFAPNRLLA